MHYTHVWFLSFMPPVVFHYSVLPLGISTAQKCQFVPKVKVNSLFKKMIISGMTVIDFATQICPMHRQQYQIVVTLNQRHT